MGVPVLSIRSPERRAEVALTFGILSTYPPTPCGLATFSAALAGGLAANGAGVRVVRVADRSLAADPRVVAELVDGSPSSVTASAKVLNDCDVAIIQHEYGLYGGADGAEVVEVMDQLRVPSIVVVHTVLRHPTPHQREVLVEVASRADHLVVMSDAASRLLCEGFDVDPAKSTTIAHGATVPARPRRTIASDAPDLLTCGLLGPGKGIERVIEALGTLRRRGLRPRYLVAGQTHPKVFAADGEAYRHARIEQSWGRGVANTVSFDDAYRDVASLTALIQSATVVVLPYDSVDQVTSGVLVDAIAAGRPVIATAFPHAVELLSTGAGIVVDHDDPDAMVLAIERVVTDSALTAAMAAEAARLAPGMGWPVVARAYQQLAEQLLLERPALR